MPTRITSLGIPNWWEGRAVNAADIYLFPASAESCGTELCPTQGARCLANETIEDDDYASWS
jgi:hypothetical protein